jgi:hypothetical protein
MKFMDHGLDYFKVFIKAALPLVLSLDVNGHLKPSIERMGVVFKIKNIGEINQLLSLHDVELYIQETEYYILRYR